MRIDGSSAIVTGGSRGLGPVIARALLARGARVTLAARSADDLEAVGEQLAANGEVVAVEADVNDAGDRERIIEEASKGFGPVDLLINNAGIEWIRHFTDYRPEDVEAIVRTNLEASIQMALLVVPGMLERRRGHIVNLSSVAGKTAVPYNTIYSSTKHALIGFSHSLRAELRGTGVGVSVVCPGHVDEVGMASRWKLIEARRGTGLATSPARVAASVVRVVERDLAEAVVSGPLGRLADVAMAISPSLSEAAVRRTGAYSALRAEAEAERALEGD